MSAPALIFDLDGTLTDPRVGIVGCLRYALQRLDRYRELAPFDPYFGLFETMYPVAYVFKGDYARAATIGWRLSV